LTDRLAVNIQTVIGACAPSLVRDDKTVLRLTTADTTTTSGSRASAARCSVSRSAMTHRRRWHLCIRRQSQRLTTCCAQTASSQLRCFRA